MRFSAQGDFSRVGSRAHCRRRGWSSTNAEIAAGRVGLHVDNDSTSVATGPDIASGSALDGHAPSSPGEQHMEYRLIAAVAAVLGLLYAALAVMAQNGERFVGAPEILRIAL
jgi:hypothetical protein